MPRPMPIIHEFVLMRGGPLEDKILRPLRQPAIEDMNRVNCDQGFVLTILGVKMGWRVVAVEHANNDAVELRFSGHRSIPGRIVRRATRGQYIADAPDGGQHDG